MKIGYIGAGAMGAPMIAQLAAKFPGDVSLFDIDPDLAARVASQTGAKAAPSIADLAGASDVLLSCVPNNDSIAQVYLEPGGVASAIGAGAITIDCSTVGPDITRKVHAHLKSMGVSHLDASMLGSVKQANEGTISFVVGGEEEAFNRARPVLEACGQMIRHCGPSGAGNHMKLIHQTLVAGHAVAVAEAMGMCLETGADIETFYDIVTGGTGFAYSRYFENRVPRMRDGDFSPLFFLKFLLKDIRLAGEMVDDKAKYPAYSAILESFEQGVDAGWGDEDFSAVMHLVEKRLGKSIKR
ncbi:MAG: NAD(P)-dependent oxidoreductase [Paracoccaceae bacterium]|nr:NAD(P)-dependent oxidoreductase [Paracoccaceae bacterium]